ncbi:MAG: hypothetical protein HWE08_07780 [Alphaproteobacteria bacterium]|nr:hypothetical protein [Alphaproteobacteria bacterium]
MKKQTWIRGLYLIVVLAALYFLFDVYLENRSVIEEWSGPSLAWAWAAGLGIAHLGLLWLLAEAWRSLVARTGEHCLPAQLLHASFLGAQVAKYLPGGVFHILGRHTWLAGKGAQHKHLAKAAVLESASMVFVAGMLACVVGAVLAFLTDYQLVVPLIGTVPVWLFGGGTFLSALGLGIMPRMLGAFSTLFPTVLIALFFIGQSVLFIVCASAVIQDASFQIVPVFLFSWILGFVVVGAPGGLGVREAALVVLSAGTIQPAEALLIGALFRIVTMIGEGLAYLAALVLVQGQADD